MSKIDKKVTLELVGQDGNAFNLMGVWRRQASREGWTKEEIDTVLKEAMSGDYNHLLVTLMEHCKSDELDDGSNRNEDEDDEDDEDDDADTDGDPDGTDDRFDRNEE